METADQDPAIDGPSLSSHPVLTSDLPKSCRVLKWCQLNLQRLTTSDHKPCTRRGMQASEYLKGKRKDWPQCGVDRARRNKIYWMFDV